MDPFMLLLIALLVTALVAIVMVSSSRTLRQHDVRPVVGQWYHLHVTTPDVLVSALNRITGDGGAAPYVIREADGYTVIAYLDWRDMSAVQRLIRDAEPRRA